MGFPHALAMSQPARSRGFSLVEAALVLVLVALVLGALLVPFGAQQEQKRIQETRDKMARVREALIGYAVARCGVTATVPCLPCPSAPGATWENTTGEPRASCATVNDAEGIVPWQALGLSKNDAVDAWTRPFRYRVLEKAVTGSGTVTHASGTNCPTTPSAITVCRRDPSGTKTFETDTVVALLLSHGPNGLGALLRAPGAATGDEAENADGNDRLFVTGTPTAADATNPFDDIVDWLSSNELCAKAPAGCANYQ
ncbi:prepilin-type N-terminal cleavage/methylation domain-containing protein [Hydrogenophilus hirschii]|mgnify:CR=1 FL=1